MLNNKIDLVYLWVNSDDKEWQEKKRFWANKLGIFSTEENNNCRFVDNEELRFSLRSAEMYAPWINKIFIITDNQVPKWLDANHPKIKIIDHKEIFPEDCLPCFNSEAIETCIANIPDLSEYFLLANDDKFFASPVTAEDFFDENNNPIVKMRAQNWNNRDIEKCLYKQSYFYTTKIFTSIITSNRDYSKFEPIHCIEAYRKSYYTECKKIFAEEFANTTQKKFRAPNSIQHPIVDMYMLECKKCKFFEDVSTLKQEFVPHLENLYLTLGNKDVMMKTINDKKPKLLCINDSESALDNHRASLPELLGLLFPKKQDWETDNIKRKNIMQTSHKNITIKNCIEDVYLANILSELKPDETAIFWGASLFLENFIEKYSLQLPNIIGIIDTNPYKQGEYLGCYKIYTPQDLARLKPDKIIISILHSTDTRKNEIQEFLLKNNFKEIKIETL